MLKKPCTVLMIFSVAIGLLLVIFPQICDWFEFDYKTTLLVWWIPLTLDIIVLFPLLVKFEYDEEKFEYTNAFGFTRIFQYEDIVEVIEKKSSVRIITTSKKIRLGRGFCGAEPFTAYLKEKSNHGKLSGRGSFDPC